jgi:hypothetical protein
MTKSLMMSVIALAATACVTPAQQTARSSAAECSAASIDSRPGQEWLKRNAWRFPSPELAAEAYRRLAQDASPWPDWYVPYKTLLPVGTRFQMAIGGTQTPATPGRFGTFDNISSVAEVREGLAVRSDWKPQVDRVVTYEVTQPLPVLIGPIGPQIDPAACKLLSGRWSQFKMEVDPSSDRVKYLRVVEVRTIH